MGDDDHPGVRYLGAALLGAIGFGQIPFGFYMAVAEPVPHAPSSSATGIVFLMVGSAMLWTAHRFWPRSALAIPTTAVVRSRLRWFYGMVGVMIAAMVGIGVAAGGFAAIPSAAPRNVVAAFGAIGLAVLAPSFWFLRNEHRILRQAEALDDHGKTVTARIIRLSTMKMGYWGTFLAGHWDSVDSGHLVTYQFKNGIPTTEPVDRETYGRVRVGDRVAVVCLPENPAVSRVP